MAKEKGIKKWKMFGGKGPEGNVEIWHVQDYLNDNFVCDCEQIIERLLNGEICKVNYKDNGSERRVLWPR